MPIDRLIYNNNAKDEKITKPRYKGLFGNGSEEQPEKDDGSHNKEIMKETDKTTRTFLTKAAKC